LPPTQKRFPNAIYLCPPPLFLRFAQMSRTAFATGAVLLALPRGGDANAKCSIAFTKLVDNFRDTQPVDPAFRSVYRSDAASNECPTSCEAGDLSTTCPADEATTEVWRPYDTSTNTHWSYADQANWADFRAFDTIVGVQASANKMWNDPKV